MEKLSISNIIDYIKSLYISPSDIEELVYNDNLCNYFETATDIPLENFHTNNPVADKKQFSKVVFDWIKNYDRKLEKKPRDFGKIMFKVFYGEDIESCSDPRGKLFTKIDGRKAIETLI